MFRIYIVLLTGLWVSACTKSAFLDTKPDNSLVVPTTLPELQAILDKDKTMNGSSNEFTGGPTPAVLVEGCDDYFMLDANYTTLTAYSQQVYIWAKDNTYGGLSSTGDWDFPYKVVFYSNIVLDGLTKISRDTVNATAWDNAKGSALFYRSWAFFHLSQAFAPLYDSATAANSLGIPLKLSPDINEPVTRASLEATYARVTQDLAAAIQLLPVTPAFKTRPSKPACYGLLARVYLSMQAYDKAGLYADSCLQLYHALLDYNTLDSTSNAPFPLFNNEVIFASLLQDIPNNELYRSSLMKIDTTLYLSYQQEDLRRVLFFRPRPPYYSFKGSYDGTTIPFTGLATDEMYLIRAEAKARSGNIAGALWDLNTLMRTRWKTGSFVDFTAASARDALALILTERRKELLQRGQRWTDLRRLNTDPAFAKTLTRIVNGVTYTLPPGDLRYTWPIPPAVISFNPGVQQNPR